jgi:hypothetical protein
MDSQANFPTSEPMDGNKRQEVIPDHLKGTLHESSNEDNHRQNSKNHMPRIYKPHKMSSYLRLLESIEKLQLQNLKLKRKIVKYKSQASNMDFLLRVINSKSEPTFNNESNENPKMKFIDDLDDISARGSDNLENTSVGKPKNVLVEEHERVSYENFENASIEVPKDTPAEDSQEKIGDFLSYVDQFINAILDDIILNTYSFLQLKPNLPNWRNMDEIFELGTIYKRSHLHSI